MTINRPLGILGKCWSEGNQPSTYKYGLLSSQLMTRVDTGIDVDWSVVRDPLSTQPESSFNSLGYSADFAASSMLPFSVYADFHISSTVTV